MRNIELPYRNERLLGVDVLKIYAIIMVVLTHCLDPLYVQARYAELWIYNAVPFFLIIGSFFYARKFNDVYSRTSSFENTCKFWYGKKSLYSYFKRISIPYLVFMLAQVAVLPLVGYATVDVALLNTIKGGMGAGGYYLVVYAQLFLLIPFLNWLYRKNPLFTGVACFTLQYAWGEVLNYIGVVLQNQSLVTDINKYLVFRFLIYFYLGMVLYYNFGKIRAEHINGTLTAAVAMELLKIAFGGHVPPIDSAFATLQSALWCFGLVTAVTYIFKNLDFKCKWISFVGGSTLHILLFQQLYFCCVGVGRNKAYIDVPIAIIGGVIVYWVFKFAGKIISEKRNFGARKAKFS